MQNKFKIFMLFFVGGTILLLSSFHNNNWQVVETSSYMTWEKVYERVIIGRLAQSNQHGIFSAGGLLGLAGLRDRSWDFDVNRQYEIYTNGETFENYSAYRSHPGFQGTVLGVFDLLTNFTPGQNIAIMRFSVALLSAMLIAVFAADLAVEFGWFSAVLVLIFSASSEWMILPAANSYWNLWAFYLPFVTGIILLGNAAKQNCYSEKKIYGILFIVTLTKILFTGFEMITTTLIMVTVPFVFHAKLQAWGWKIFMKRMVVLGVILLAATLVGAAILAAQIAANSGGIMGAINYILETFDKRAAGNPENYKDLYAESMAVSVFTVIGKYLNINAFNTQTTPRLWQVPYWQLIASFVGFTVVFVAKYKFKRRQMPEKGLALMIATWYSMAAPLSWFIIFKPTSYIHTFLFPMAWQMPFVLLGFALCGYVIQDFLESK